MKTNPRRRGYRALGMQRKALRARKQASKVKPVPPGMTISDSAGVRIIAMDTPEAHTILEGKISEYRARLGDFTEERSRIRRMIAQNMLQAMIQSAPMCDRTGVDETKWAAKAIAFTDALLKELDK